MSDPILEDDIHRYTLFPIKYPKLWEAYKKHKNAFWTSEEIDFSADKNDWDRLNSDEKYFIENILAFFAGSDGIVLENLITNFCAEVMIPEARCFYAFQAMMENIHCVVGHTLLLTDKGYIPIQDLVNQHVLIWNGQNFESVYVRYTGHSYIYSIYLSNGLEVQCTPNHEWITQDGNRVETRDIKCGEILSKYILPIQMNQNTEFKNPYLHGYACRNAISLHNKYIVYTNDELRKQFNIQTHYMYIDEYLNEKLYTVPLNYDLTIQKEWIRGMICDKFDNTDINQVFISHQNYDFIQKILILLLHLGYKTRLVYEHNVYSIYLREKYVELSEEERMITVDSLSINKIELQISEQEATYCFNEPNLKTGVFNGILTGQSESYSLMIESLVKDERRKKQLLEGITQIPCVEKKANWAIKWIKDKTHSFAKRLFAFAVVEGLFFSGSFCAIFWLKERNLMTKALGKSNEWIARDESLHTEFAVLLYHHLQKGLEQEEAYSILNEAFEIEEEFICHSLPVKLIGMNPTLMSQYIRFCADRLLCQFGFDKLYKVTNPFPWMEKISVDGKTNFFEQRVSEYSMVEENNVEFEFDM
jgi:ribonucleotide reductase beta subunit family protein with ferritin-like domain